MTCLIINYVPSLWILTQFRNRHRCQVEITVSALLLAVLFAVWGLDMCPRFPPIFPQTKLFHSLVFWMSGLPRQVPSPPSKLPHGRLKNMLGQRVDRLALPSTSAYELRLASGTRQIGHFCYEVKREGEVSSLVSSPIHFWKYLLPSENWKNKLSHL